MAKTNFYKKNEAAFSKMLMVLFLLIFFSLGIPAIGYEDALTSPSWWVSTVDFFTSIRDHVSSYWMFYTLGGAVLFASLRKSK